MVAFSRRDFEGAAAATTLTAGITSGDSTFTIASAAGWPDASNGDFFVVIDRGTAGEEKIRCSARSSTTITVQTAGRGSDGTSASSHSSGAAVEHCLTALDLDEANNVVKQTLGTVTTAGDLLYATGAGALTRLALGSSGLALKAGGSAPAWGTLSSTALAADSVTSSQIAADAVGSSEIAAAAVTASELASDAVTTVKILDLNVTTGKINDLAVTTGKLAANAVTAGKITDATITATQLATSVAGAGLAGGGGVALAVNVDNSTVEITTDTLNVKAAGIGATQLGAAIPLGILGYTGVTADITTLGVDGAVHDLSGLSVTVTVAASRRIKVTIHIPQYLAGTNNTAAAIQIRESSTTLQSDFINFIAATGTAAFHTVCILSPTAGSHTYKASHTSTAGGGNGTIKAASTNPAFIMVEDIGGA